MTECDKRVEEKQYFILPALLNCLLVLVYFWYKCWKMSAHREPLVTVDGALQGRNLQHCHMTVEECLAKMDKPPSYEELFPEQKSDEVVLKIM